ncbi:hypothetical protein [Herbidospora sp. RD11066]
MFVARLREILEPVRVSWRLWTGPDRLPLRLRLTFTDPGARADRRAGTTVAEVRFTGWGREVDVEIPPADQVRETTECQAPEPA